MVTKFSEEQKLYAVKLYQEGNTVIEVESLTGISSAYVKDLLKKYNVPARPSGFQLGNSARSGISHSIETKKKISLKHKLSGHQPSKEAIANGQPKTLIKRWENHKKDPVDYLIKGYKRGAESRNLLFDLSREDFEHLINQNCYYCGVPPSERFVKNKNKLICNGIDRVNNKLGYFIENCVSSCKFCNIMKSTMGEQDFFQSLLSGCKSFY
jgi:transposase